MLRFIEFFSIFLLLHIFSISTYESWTPRMMIRKKYKARKSNEIVGEKNQPEVMSCTFSSIRFCCALTWCQAYLLGFFMWNFLLTILNYYSITWTEGMDIFIVCFLDLLTLTEIYNILLKIIHPSRRAKWAAVGGTLEFLFLPSPHHLVMIIDTMSCVYCYFFPSIKSIDVCRFSSQPY